MRRGHYLEGCKDILLFLSQPYEIAGPFEEPEKELVLGWLSFVDGDYHFDPVPIRKDELYENRLVLEAAGLECANLDNRLRTWEGLGSSAPGLAQRINDWNARIIYWDHEEDRELARRLIALVGTRECVLTWGPPE